MIRHLHFHNLLYEENLLPGFYQDTSGLHDTRMPPAGGVSVVHLIPPYLPGGGPQLQSGFSSYPCRVHRSYLVDLTQAEKIDALLRDALGSRRYKNCRRLKRRLEERVDFRFAVYTEKMDAGAYRELMAGLRTMIRRRFDQKDVNHDSLGRWEDIVQHTRDRIRENQASLMAIYDGDTPIAIGLNYHRLGVLASAITGFDTEFEPFGLGKLMLLEKIRWAFANDFRIVDLGWGDLKHKEDLANRMEAYRTDVVYPAARPHLRLLAWGIAQFLRIKHRKTEWS